MINDLLCELCGKDLTKAIDDGLIVFKKAQGQKIVDVKTVCRGKCDDSLNKKLMDEGYYTGSKEMNNGSKYLYEESDFTSESLIKYNEILNKFDMKK